MLETVREYASEQLDADPDAAQVRERHCRHYLALVERAEPELFTRGKPVAAAARSRGRQSPGGA